MPSETVKKTLIYSSLYILTFALVASVFLWQPNQTDTFPYLRLFIIFFATTLLTKYFVYMTFSPWYDVWVRRARKRAKEERQGRFNPRVSVVIPAWNEEVGLVQTVQSVLLSTYQNTEIVIVNDGSSDDSDEKMREFIAAREKGQLLGGDRGKIDISYHYKQNGGKGRALNYGIMRAQGDIIISIDADCVLMPGTIANFVRYFEDPHVMAAVGNVKIGNTQTFLGTLQYLEFLFSFYFKKADSIFQTIYIIGGAAGAFRREVFETVGLYSDRNITEDIDLSVRIQEAGMRIVYASDAVVYTEGAATIAGLTAQRLRWKRGRFQTFAEYKHLFFSARSEHNKLLTWLVLPLAIFGDIQLFFEMWFLAFLYVYSSLTHDFSSFLSGIVVVSSIFIVQIFDDRANSRRLELYLLAPIGWLLFYVTTMVEHRALIRSIQGMFSKKTIQWQKWERHGCLPTDTVKQPLISSP